MCLEEGNDVQIPEFDQSLEGGNVAWSIIEDRLRDFYMLIRRDSYPKP